MRETRRERKRWSRKERERMKDRDEEKNIESSPLATHIIRRCRREQHLGLLVSPLRQDGDRERERKATKTQMLRIWVWHLGQATVYS